MSIIEKQIKKLIKKSGTFPIYVSAFLLSISACLSLGILTLFSVFADPLKLILGYKQATINSIIIFHVLGLNIFTPLSGYIADAEGIWILPIFSFFGYILGFNLILLVVEHQLHRFYIFFSFFIIGCSHVSLLFGCLLNSARSLGPYYRTMAISTPNMMISISSYIQIQILTIYFIPTDYSDIQAVKSNFIAILKFFLFTLTAATVLSFLGCKLADKIELYELSDIDLSSNAIDHETFLSFDTSPLLTGAGTVIPTNGSTPLGSPGMLYLDDNSSIPNLDQELSISSVHSFEPSSIYKRKVEGFLLDPLMYPLLVCCLLSIGSTEFFINNMSTILSNINTQNLLDEQLKLLSISSTVTRFMVMIFTDKFCTKFEVSRLTIFACAVFLCGASHIYLSSTSVLSINFSLIVICNAILNSAVFTLFPAILAGIYGIDILGTTWGLCSSSSVIGNMFLNLLYSFDYNLNCAGDLSNKLVICSTLTFFISGVFLVLISLILFILRPKYFHRMSAFF